MKLISSLVLSCLVIVSQAQAFAEGSTSGGGSELPLSVMCEFSDATSSYLLFLQPNVLPQADGNATLSHTGSNVYIENGWLGNSYIMGVDGHPYLQMNSSGNLGRRILEGPASDVKLRRENGNFLARVNVILYGSVPTLQEIAKFKTNKSSQLNNAEFRYAFLSHTRLNVTEMPGICGFISRQ